ncbi:MAG: hypothetical protein V1787_05025 [Candidatus Micrarchaeota archaeon]
MNCRKAWDGLGESEFRWRVSSNVSGAFLRRSEFANCSKGPSPGSGESAGSAEWNARRVYAATEIIVRSELPAEAARLLVGHIDSARQRLGEEHPLSVQLLELFKANWRRLNPSPENP